MCKRILTNGRLSRLAAAGAAALLLAHGAGAARTAKSAPAPPERPNVVLIVVDTLRADHLSCYGYPKVTSHHIDSRLAAKGVRFAHATAHAGLTGPSHASIFASLYPQEHGAVRNGVHVLDSVPLLAEAFREAGYATGAFVSGWTLLDRMCGLARGFDIYNEDMRDRYRVVNTKRSAEDTLPAALAWMRATAQKDRPFFMFLHFFDPHAPYRPHPEYASPAKNPDADPRWNFAGKTAKPKRNARQAAYYDAEISYTDFHVGKFLDALETMELTERTLVVLTADHGESLGEHGYEGHGRELYETNLWVPLIARYDSHIPQGKVIRETVAHVDIAPTLLDWAGIKAPEGFRGISLRDWMSTNGHAGPLPPRELYFQAYPGAVGHVPRFARWLMRQKPSLTPLKIGMLVSPHKVIYTPSTGALEVYDLSRDPFELVNVADRMPRYRESGKRLVRWHETTSADLPESPSLSREDREKLQSLGYVR